MSTLPITSGNTASSRASSRTNSALPALGKSRSFCGHFNVKIVWYPRAPASSVAFPDSFASATDQPAAAQPPRKN